MSGGGENADAADLSTRGACEPCGAGPHSGDRPGLRYLLAFLAVTCPLNLA